MNDETKLPQQEADHTPPPEDPSQVLSPRRRSALVTYLAILFAVAFLFVAVMMVVETQRLKNLNEELKDSSQKTSASLTSNINALQEENQRLSGVNEELNSRIADLEASLSGQEDQNKELRSRAESLEQEAETLRQEKESLEEQAELLTQQAQDAIEVSELLQKAIAADEEGKMKKLQELLEQIEPLKELLSPSELEWYENLKID